MSLSAGAHPKRKSKKVLDPDFQYEFPLNTFIQDDLNLEEQSNLVMFIQSTKHSTQSSKLKSATASSSPITIDDTASSALSFRWCLLSSIGVKKTQCLFSTSPCLLVLLSCRFIMSSCPLGLSSCRFVLSSCLLAWNSSNCLESFSPLNNVWIWMDRPLMPSSDATHYPKTG